MSSFRMIITIGEALLFSILYISDKASAASDVHQLAAFRRREPNNVQCFKNSDCLSDCCISNNGWVGICVGKPQIGQICGLFTTANSAPPSNPWSWSYGGVLGNMLMNGNGGTTASGAVQQQTPSARQGNNGAWVADLNALLQNNPSASSGQQQNYDTQSMMQAYHHGNGGNGGMDYNSGNGGQGSNGYGHGGGHHGTGGFNMNNFDLSSLKYGNKFGKRSTNTMYG